MRRIAIFFFRRCNYLFFNVIEDYSNLPLKNDRRLKIIRLLLEKGEVDVNATLAEDGSSPPLRSRAKT